MSPPSGEPRVVAAIRERIDARGWIPFSEFMELALHQPECGYYARGAARIGPGGDFITASDLGPAFGFALARQIEEMSTQLGADGPFSITEFGAGRGWLARDVVAAVEPALRSRMSYRAVDASVGMREAIRDGGIEVYPPAEPPAAAPGVALAVELFDALPVHRVRRTDSQLIELGVTTDGERFVEHAVTASEPLQSWAERYGAAAEEGSEAEICLAYDDAFAMLDRSVEQGFAIVIDYGDRASRLYSDRHHRGTLLAYHRHQTNEAYFDRVGEQDLTAHVNFDALTDAAERAGWRALGGTTQDRFLIANDILNCFEAGDAESYQDPSRVQSRLQMRQLIEPTGMGRIFKVYLFAKGVSADYAARGLTDPFARGGRG